MITAVVAFLTDHCCNLLIECKRHLVEALCIEEAGRRENEVSALYKRRLELEMTYSDVAHLAYGPWGSRLINVFLVYTQMGFCIGYAVFIGNTLHNMISSFSKSKVIEDWTYSTLHDYVTTSSDVITDIVNKTMSEPRNYSLVSMTHQNTSIQAMALTELMTSTQTLTVTTDIDTELDTNTHLVLLILACLPILIPFTYFR